MAVVEVTEYKTGRESVSGQLNRRIYQRHFCVRTNNPHTASKEVKIAALIPRPYQPYVTLTEQDYGALVRSVTATQRENSRLLWDVLVAYDSEVELRDNPFLEPPDIRLDTEIYERALIARFDKAHNPEASQNPEFGDPLNAIEPNGLIRGDYCTSAGEPFDPPLMVTEARPLVIFTRNEAIFTVAKKVKYENTLNKYEWCGLQPRQAWLRSIKVQNHVQKATDTQSANIYYVRVEYTFALNAITWDLQVPDIGSYYLDYASGTAVRRAFVVEGTGQPRLGRLDHSVAAQPGKKLAAGEDVQFLKFPDTKRHEVFANLGIDLNLALEERRQRRRGD
jgi:hypothetical protein